MVNKRSDAETRNWLRRLYLCFRICGQIRPQLSRAVRYGELGQCIDRKHGNRDEGIVVAPSITPITGVKIGGFSLDVWIWLLLARLYWGRVNDVPGGEMAWML